MITHPHHPLYGHQVEVVGLRQGANPDLIVRLPDGTHAAIARSSTDDAATSSTPPPPPHATYLLALDGLRQIALWIDRRRQKGHFPSHKS